MTSGWLYHQNPMCIVLALVAIMSLAAEVTFRVGRRWHTRSDDFRRGHFGSVLGSLLGLLALLLSFTFAMSANRFDARRQLVLSDANALEALYLQSSLLSDGARRTFKQSLRQYVDAQAQVAAMTHDATAAEARGISAQWEAIHQQMWNTVKECVTETPSPVDDQMLRSLIDLRAINRARMFAWDNRVPDSIIWLLLLGCIVGISAIGLSGGLGNHRGWPARVALTVVLSATIYVVLDLDRPHEGLISVSQKPILDLQERLRADPEAARP